MRKREFSRRVVAAALAGVMAVGTFMTLPQSNVRAQEQETAVELQAASDTALPREYTISNVREFKDFVSLASAGNNFANVVVKLTNNIVFDNTPDNYTSIPYFAGIFDGCGYTISGIYQKWGNGIFNTISETAEIRNLYVQDCTFDVKGYIANHGDSVGAILGWAYGGTIRNCHTVNVTVKVAEGNYVGGILGESAKVGYKSGQVDIINCSVQGGSVSINNKSRGEQYAGSLAGSCQSIYNSWSTTSVNSNNYGLDDHYVGGLAGWVIDMQNCFFAGTVKGGTNITEDPGPRAKKDPVVGALAGYGRQIVENNYCLEGAYSTMFGELDCSAETNKTYTAAYMQSQAFLNQMNANIGDRTDWMLWEKRAESVYPVHVYGIPLANCSVTLSVPSAEYTGEEISPAVSVIYNGKALTQDVDYRVLYANNIEVGQASVVVIGEGMYMGSALLPFTIEKATPKLSYVSAYKVTYGQRGFVLNLNRNGAENEITFTSSNPKVVSVSDKGTVTVLRPGKATVTMHLLACDHYKTADYKISFTVKPAKPSVYVSSKNRNLTMTWYRDTLVSGYELQYSTNKSFKKHVKKVTFKKNKTVKKVAKKLKKGRKYYVRIRSYKTVSGKKLYSSWSAKRTIKIK